MHPAFDSHFPAGALLGRDIDPGSRIISQQDNVKARPHPCSRLKRWTPRRTSSRISCARFAIQDTPAWSAIMLERLDEVNQRRRFYWHTAGLVCPDAGARNRVRVFL